MYSSGKRLSSDPELLNSSRVSSMIREFNVYQRCHSKTPTERVALGSINFDESSTEEISLLPARKVQILDVPSTVKEEPTPPSLSGTGLLRKCVEKDMELQHAKATISDLKTAALNFEPEAKRVSIELGKKLEKKNNECDNLKERLLCLTNHIHLMEQQEAGTQANYEQERDALQSNHNKLQQKLKTVQAEKDELESTLEKIKNSNTITVKQLQNEVMRLKLELRLNHDENEQLEKQHKSAVKVLQEKVITETLKVKSELDSKILELELELKRRNDETQATNVMMEDLKRLVSLEKENTRLTDENKTLRKSKENVFLLKEKLLSLQENVENAKLESERNQHLEVENYELRCKLEKWESVASSPTKVSGFLSQLQRNEVTLTDQASKLKSELLSTKTKVIDLEKQVSVLQSQLKQSKDSQEVSASNMKLTRRQLLFLRKECESYKNLINSYQSDLTVNINDINHTRMTELENLLEEYKEALASYDIKPSNLCDQKEPSENELLLKAEVKKLEHVVQMLQRQIQAYEGLRTAPEKQVKIFHMRGNMVVTDTQNQERNIKKLTEENERLRNRIQVLETGTTADVTVEAEKLRIEHGKDTVESLRQEIMLAKQKNDRMMEAFKKTSHELREAVYLLTGYKVDILTGCKYKLSHLYSNSPHDYLLFEQTSNGELQLLETDYSKSIGNLIEEYLIKLHSIPVFLSNITTELFYQQTVFSS